MRMRSSIFTRLQRRLGSIVRERLGTEKISYAQCGEDLILEYLFASLDTTSVRYIDIGAHHPSYLSNTYLFYRHGGAGVCVEPDPRAIPRFQKLRPRDHCLNVGIGPEPGTAILYVMTTPTLSTFSRDEAERYASYGTEQIESTLHIPMRNINEVIETECRGVPDLISIDVEGYDLPILQSLDFGRWRPKVLCVETLTYAENGEGHKLNGTIEFLQSKGYVLYADTYINSIMVDCNIWSRQMALRASLPA